MIRKIIFIICISLLYCNQTMSDYVFEHSFNNINFSESDYNLKIIKSQNNKFNYNINWTPTSNLIVNTYFINNITNDNKVCYGFNFGLLFSKNLHSLLIGMGTNNLKFDQQFNKLQWLNYFINSQFDIYQWFNINLGLSYYNNNQFSFFAIAFHLNKNINKNLNIGLGSDFSMASFINKIYFSINYSL